MNISRAGFFRELPHGDPNGESLREAVERDTDQDTAKLLRYLEGNVVLAATAALVDDVLDHTARAVAPLELVTDGAWVWPRDLAYYVEKYDAAVPATFILHLELRNWVQPHLGENELQQVEEAFLGPDY
ncbi:hypothetical protein GCM10022223_61920 [Kineosporia mesophila]|uniref:Uncharacterized protein n=1 Tax=Kineosporia mesophila TaxID=566012 RepID=A0ABP7ALU8_9ACTN|nr:hypothetical protein [Kineosporia mesophila]MCD5353997.1 hypothetical protein [Kineosporia mesophila]